MLLTPDFPTYIPNNPINHSLSSIEMNVWVKLVNPASNDDHNVVEDP